MRCPNCNNELSDVNARFCPNCGYVISQAQMNAFTYSSNSTSTNGNWSANNSNMYQTPQNNSTSNNLPLKIGCSILAIIFLIGGLGTFINCIIAFVNMFSWIFSLSTLFNTLFNVVFSVLKGILQLTLAAVLPLIAFTTKRHRIPELFAALAVSNLAIGIWVLILRTREFQLVFL